MVKKQIADNIKLYGVDIFKQAERMWKNSPVQETASTSMIQNDQQVAAQLHTTCSTVQRFISDVLRYSKEKVIYKGVEKNHENSETEADKTQAQTASLITRRRAKRKSSEEGLWYFGATMKSLMAGRSWIRVQKQPT
ncbi:hypothetical protein NPIL_417071 [Nephila pilipes]|uniref:Uncharacterized protein n=1 Tax=Nephila pilipes TaxID=299642 RepID=A0A8X6URB8_NEPPI|nr:hypothetical protein NPIL_417071 [Nephila pilipes]